MILTINCPTDTYTHAYIVHGVLSHSTPLIYNCTVHIHCLLLLNRISVVPIVLVNEAGHVSLQAIRFHSHSIHICYPPSYKLWISFYL